jgi:hypothetical protein
VFVKIFFPNDMKMDDHIGLLRDLYRLVEMEFDLMMTRRALDEKQRIQFRQLLASINYSINYNKFQVSLW